MFQTPTAGHLANVTEYVTRKFVKYMSFEMHPHSVLSLAKYEYHPPMVWLLPQLATKMRNIKTNMLCNPKINNMKVDVFSLLCNDKLKLFNYKNNCTLGKILDNLFIYQN